MTKENNKIKKITLISLLALLALLLTIVVVITGQNTIANIYGMVSSNEQAEQKISSTATIDNFR